MDNTPTRPPPRLRVTKTIAPGEPGALKWSRRYGAALVCVRYRRRAGSQVRYTTIELVVDEMPVQPRTDPIVEVAKYIRDAEARARAMALGARWDATRHVWRMHRSVAKRLGLQPKKTHRQD